MSNQAWKTTELAIIRQHYPRSGVQRCEQLLPHRTRGAIFQQARQLGLSAPNGGPRAKPYTSTEWIDAQIRRTYEAGLKRGDRRRLAKRIDRPEWWVSKRAVQMGIAIPPRQDPEWTDDEIKILEDTLHLTVHVVAQRLRKAGYSRTPTAVKVKRGRLSLRQQRETYTARELAALMGIPCEKKVTRWIAEGKLRATRRGTAREDNDPWEIRPADVRALIIGYTAEIDIRKCDKFWLVDLLTGSTSAKAAAA